MPSKLQGLREYNYPFASIVGHVAVKRGLLLLAVEPGLRGALFASDRSSEAISLFRSFAAIFSDGNIDSPIKFDRRRDIPIVEVPVNVTEDRLLGSLDLDRSISSGTSEVRGGLLADADGGLLMVGDINLLDSSIANHIAHALDRKQVLLEREGVSAIHSADFKLLACFDPTTGDPRPLLTERVDLIVTAIEQYSAGERAEAVERRLRFEKDPSGFAEEFVLETAELRSLIQEARARVTKIRFSTKLIRIISQIATRLGVQGNRADVGALKTARANAALAGRSEINEDDIVVAIQLVLAPRATKLPVEHPEKQYEQPDEAGNSREDGQIDQHDLAQGSIEELIIEAVDTPIPKDLLSPLKPDARSARSGKHSGASTFDRGRYVRSVMHRNGDARIAVDATLRAAAPHQLLRRSRVQNDTSSHNLTSRRVRVEPSDLRFKQLKHRSGILFILAVDASGSMAINRLAQAKGALTRLLGRAYLYRDKVAMISFRGKQAEVLLSPTRSVEIAKRIVDSLPAGGGTPISAAVLKATDLARMARLKGLSHAMLVLFTDGRANVALTGGSAKPTDLTIDDELKRLGRLLDLEKISSVVVDTKSRFISSGEGRALAQKLGSRYLYLPRFDAASVGREVFAIAKEHRGDYLNER